MRKEERPSVWVPQEPYGKDITAAMDFGEMRPIFKGRLPLLDVTESFYSLENWAKNQYSPSTDYIVLVGDPLAIGMVVTWALNCANEGDELKFLKWDRFKERYITTILTY